jgi:DNA topoisomerase-3
MQNAWRFVEDEALRERLKEAKGIGTPATRAEIINGLKKQSFLTTQKKTIVPTETGLSLYGILKQADATLVDPGATAELEYLLDDVLVEKQEMMGAIDAVCDVAERIISKLTEGAATAGPPVLGAARASDAKGRAPTPAMKRFAKSLAQQIGIEPPPGYTTSIAICRAFLNEHAPKKTSDNEVENPSTKPASAKQIAFAEKIAQEKAIEIPEEAKASVAVMAKWIDENKGTKRGKGGRKSTGRKPGSTASKRNARKRATHNSSASTDHAGQDGENETPLAIPYGNKETAMKLGARYRPGGWYAPAGVDLAAFEERGWYIKEPSPAGDAS